MSESWDEYAVELTGDAARRYLSRRLHLHGQDRMLAAWEGGGRRPLQVTFGRSRICPDSELESARQHARDLGGTVLRRTVRAGDWETHPS